MGEQHRLKTKQFKFWLDEKVFRILEQKAAAANLSKTNFLAKLIVDGAVIKIDTVNIPKLSNEINKIGVNINQIAYKVNSHNGAVRRDEFAMLQDDFLQLQKTIYAAIWGDL